MDITKTINAHVRFGGAGRTERRHAFRQVPSRPASFSFVFQAGVAVDAPLADLPPGPVHRLGYL